MVNVLFESFLDSEGQYHACERYWESIVSAIADSLGQANEWPRWTTRQNPDGTAMELDGNPIFDGWSKRLNRAFKVIQHRQIGEEVEIAAWVKAYEPEYKDLPSHELVLNLALSEESASLARPLIHEWMKPDMTAEEMTHLIRNNIGHPGKPIGD